VSPHNATTDFDASRQLDKSTFIDNSMYVPTPKLWAKQQVSSFMVTLPYAIKYGITTLS